MNTSPTTLPTQGEAQNEGAATLLMGPPGSGKSYSITTLIACGLDVFVLGTEPRYLESYLDSLKARNLPIEKFHYMTVKPLTQSWQSMIDSAKLINTFNIEQLCQMKSGIGKENYNQYIKVLSACANFVDERTGVSYGAIDSWGSDRAFVLDSLSGLNLMALDLVVGSKPTRAQGEWGVAMDNEERLINTWCSALKCFFVLTAHVEREPNEITGGVTVQVGALGRKLAPRIPRFFSEVVLCYREGDKYWWSTTTAMHDLKRRVLPLSDKIAPDFKPIVDAWRSRLVTQTPKVAA